MKNKTCKEKGNIRIFVKDMIVYLGNLGDLYSELLQMIKELKM